MMKERFAKARWKIKKWFREFGEWLLYGIVLHILVILWAMICGRLAYGSSSQFWLVGVYITIISFVASAPVAYKGWFNYASEEDLEFIYLVMGWAAGLVLTFLGSIVYLIARFFFNVVPPDAWILASWVGAISVGFAIIVVAVTKYKNRQKKQLADASQ